MSTELVTAQKPQVPGHGILGLSPEATIERATAVANVLKDVIVKQGLWSRIGDKDYVKVEAWATMGTLLGITPRESRVVEMKDGSYEAYVELVDFRTNAVLGGASAICGMDEKRWSRADRYARRSMAITRATGKAYRLGFAWVMTLAGYQPTPAEEMPEDDAPTPKQEPDRSTRPASAPARSSDTVDAEFSDAAPKGKLSDEIYDGSPRQERAVAKLLCERKIAEKHWERIHKALHGKPIRELATVVPAVLAAAASDRPKAPNGAEVEIPF